MRNEGDNLKYNDQMDMTIPDAYPDKLLEDEYDDAERAAIERADQRLDDEKNRMLGNQKNEV